MEKENIQDIVNINLKSFFKILFRRKTAFLIAFIVTLAAGSIYAFLFSTEYNSISKITLSDSELYYSEELYKYMPEIADSLLIIPTYKEEKELYYIVDKLEVIEGEIKSDFIINNVQKALYENLLYEIKREKLVKSINIIFDRWIGNLTITTYSDSPEIAYLINKNVLDFYTEFKRKELEKSYNGAIKKIDAEIINAEELLSGLLKEKEMSNIAPILSVKINEEYKKHDVLTTTKQNLLNNKDYYINRIKIIESPEIGNVENVSNYLRNILLSLMAAFITGVIAAFTVNYFKSTKKSNL